MATCVKTKDNPAIRHSFMGTAGNILPTGKDIDEIWCELGETVPTQTVTYSTGYVYHANGEPIYVFNIGNSAANEYLIAVPRRHLKSLTIKTKAAG